MGVGRGLTITCPCVLCGSFTTISIHRVSVMANASVLPVPVPTKVDAVELLVDNGIPHIPQAYVRPPQERPRVPTGPPSLEVPLIDLQGLDSDDGIEREIVLNQLGNACDEWGFFQIVNHGIPLSLMESMMDVCKEFFALPVEEKQSYAALPGIIQQGYGSRYVAREDATRDWRDFLYLFLHPHSIRKYGYWPPEPSLFREVVDKYSEEARKVAQRLLGAFSLNLGLPGTYLEEALGEIHQKMLINYYPRCPEPHLTSGFHPHSDIGAVTLLLQEPGSTALHVRKGDQWIPVKAHPGALLVNVADQVEILSNGRYKSVEHRVVVDKEKPRISIPVFHDAAPNAVIKPAPPLLGTARTGNGDGERDDIAKYRSVVFKDHEIAFYTDGADGKKYVQSYRVQTP